MVTLLNGAGELMTNDMRKDEVLNASASVPTGKPRLQEPQASQARWKVWDPREDISSGEEDQIREPLNKFDIHKSMGPMGCPHKYWRNRLMSLQGHPWLSLKGYGSWKRLLKTVREQITLMFTNSTEKDSENYRPDRFTWVPSKMMEQIILKNISKLLKDKKVTGIGQHGFRKGKSCLANLIITWWMRQEKWMLLGSTFIWLLTLTVSLNILINDLTKYRLDKQTERWIENWLHSQVQRVVISYNKSSWKQVTSGVLQKSIQGPMLL